MNRIRIVIADDHAVVRQGTRSLLEREKDLEVVGEAGDGEEAVNLICSLRPDVAIIDIAMPKLNGIEVTRRIKPACPSTAVLILSAYDDDEYIVALLEAGALGYVPKKAVSTELAAAIRVVAAGDVFLHPSIAKGVTRDYVQLVQTGRKVEPYERLTDREHEILKLLAEGYSSHQIADRLYLTPKTVLNYRKAVMEKLGLENPAQLIKYAIKMGLDDDDG
jgi:DNA-binding NarL/FixJ family response regulator